MAVFVKWIYPHIEQGKSHARPSMPLCFKRLCESSVTWNIHSLDDNDRAEFWEVDVAKLDPLLVDQTLTAAEVELLVYGPEGKAAWIAANAPQIPS